MTLIFDLLTTRPLLTGEKEYGSLRRRRNSQPNLTEAREAGAGAGAGAGVPGHVQGVGNINTAQVQPLGDSR